MERRRAGAFALDAAQAQRAAVVAKIARDSGALTIAVVTKPFTMEGKRKMNFANEGLSKLKEA
ncbi:MAG: hypothetical protein IJH84_04910, partial [Saccharopolyspora sp.]